MDLDEAIDALYAASPEEFVSTRAGLARELKGEGRPDDAAAIAAVRKPPLAAWTLNQLSRRNRREVDLLLDAGHRLRDAQAAVLRGAKRDVFERAKSDETKALARLLDEAEKLLQSRGTASATVLGQIRESLEAAAVSDEGRTLLARGRFTGAISRSGFDLVGAPAASSPRARRGRPGPHREPTTASTRSRRSARRRRGSATQSARPVRPGSRPTSSGRMPTRRAGPPSRPTRRATRPPPRSRSSSGSCAAAKPQYRKLNVRWVG